METGTLVSGLGHAGLILWVILGDFLFSPQDVPPVAVTTVSLMSTSEFEELAAVASSPTPAPEVAPEPVVTPAPEPEPEPEPVPEPVPEVQPPPPLDPALEPPPAPEPDPQPEPQPEDVPEPVAPVADVEQPLPSASPELRPKPRPADRVAPDPAPTPEPEAVTDPEPTPAVSDTPTEEPVVIEEPTEEAVAEEAGDVLRTEATEDQDQSLGMTTSPRPKSRPAARAEAPAEEVATATETPAETPAETAAETLSEPEADPEADAIAAALAEATASEATAQSERPAGPPMSFGEQDALRVAVAACWSVGTVSSEAMRTTVTVRVDMEPNGRPVPSSIRMTGFEGGSDAAAKIMFDAARRAVIRCTKEGYPLPPEKYEQWRDLELVFDPTGMVLR